MVTQIRSLRLSSLTLGLMCAGSINYIRAGTIQDVTYGTDVLIPSGSTLEMRYIPSTLRDAVIAAGATFQPTYLQWSLSSIFNEVTADVSLFFGSSSQEMRLGQVLTYLAPVTISSQVGIFEGTQVTSAPVYFTPELLALIGDGTTEIVLGVRVNSGSIRANLALAGMNFALTQQLPEVQIGAGPSSYTITLRSEEPVPEPASSLLMSSGALLLLAASIRFRPRLPV
ncbi:MAG: hypothetical protein H7039_20250 [Bryobacteraceae bacterium]|nr:hypothetical protein [Bryobacteraceae bacterium]